MRPIVEVFVNGDGPFRFVVDTGATRTMVSKDLAERLRLPESGTVLVGAPNSFTLITAPVHRIRELRVKDLKFFGVSAVAILDQDFSKQIQADGVISAQDFHGYLVTFDYRHRQLVIEPGRLDDPEDRSVFALEDRFGISGIELDVMGRPTFFHLDTGAPFSIALPGAMSNTVEFERRPVVTGKASTVVGEFVVYSAKLAGDVSVGKTVLSKPNVELLDKMPFGNLGYQFFRDFRITFDYASERVRLVYWKDQASPPPH